MFLIYKNKGEEKKLNIFMIECNIDFYSRCCCYQNIESKIYLFSYDMSLYRPGSFF